MAFAIAGALPDFITLDSITLTAKVTAAGARVVRLTIELSNKIFLLDDKTLLFGRSMYFVSVIKLPSSIYYCGITILKITEVHSFKTGLRFSKDVCQKISLIGKDLMNLLKGMKAFGCLHERHFWLIKPTPFFCLVAGLALIGKLYGQVLEYQRCQIEWLQNPQPNQQVENKFTASKLSLASAALDIGGIAILSLTPLFLTPLGIPAYSLLTLSSAASLARCILAG